MVDDEGIVSVCTLMMFSVITATTMFCESDKEREDVESNA